MTVQLCWDCSYALPRTCPLRLLPSVGTRVDPRWIKSKPICLPIHLLQSSSIIPEEICTSNVFYFKISTSLNFVLEEGSLWERRELLLPAGAMGLVSHLAPLITHCHHPLLQRHPEHKGQNFEGNEKPTSFLPSLGRTQPLPVFSHSQLWLQSHHLALTAFNHCTVLFFIWSGLMFLRSWNIHSLLLLLYLFSSVFAWSLGVEEGSWN